MAKVTTKLQVTIPKALAEQYGIAPGDDIEFQAAGPVIRITPTKRRRERLSLQERVRLFEAATARQREREAHMHLASQAPAERDWKREDLYTRGESD